MQRFRGTPNATESRERFSKSNTPAGKKEKRIMKKKKKGKKSSSHTWMRTNEAPIAQGLLRSSDLKTDFEDWFCVQKKLIHILDLFAGATGGHRWRRADTNVVSVKFDHLESMSNMHTGDPTHCTQCDAVLSYLSKLTPQEDDVMVRQNQVISQVFLRSVFSVLEMWVLWLCEWAGNLPWRATSNRGCHVSHSRCSPCKGFQFGWLAGYLLCGCLWKHEYHYWGKHFFFLFLNYFWFAGWRKLPSTWSAPSTTSQKQWHESFSEWAGDLRVSLAVCASCRGCTAASFAKWASEATSLLDFV